MFRLFFIFCICFSFANANEKIKPANIRVLLEKDIYEALLEVKGPYYIFNPYNGTKISSGVLEKRFMIRAIPIGLKWGQEFPGTHQMLIVPRGKKTKILVNGIQYDGAIAIFKIHDKINIINEIDVESYIKSILTTEFTYPLEKEAMAAVAIASRTNAYFKISNNQDLYWHIDSKKINYQGSALIINDSIITKSIEDTKNLLLVKNETVPFEAVWTDHSAGKTASFNEIFRKKTDSTQISMDIPIASLDREDSHWSYSISIEQFSKIFKIKKLEDIKLYQDNASSKIYAIKIISDNIKDLDFFTLQNKLGKKNIKSNDFKISIHDNKIHFDGYGKGHSVGMCLYSASNMAQNGENASKILSKFYPKTSIISIKK